jgi:hypothetical protein
MKVWTGSAGPELDPVAGFLEHINEYCGTMYNSKEYLNQLSDSHFKTY